MRVRRLADIGHAVRDARVSLGMSQTEVAAGAGVTRYVVTNLESGKGNPTLSTLLAVLDAVGLGVEVGADRIVTPGSARRLMPPVDLDVVLDRTKGR